jgi:broad specificity phosphatase PhoE
LKLILVRHAETYWNEQRRVQGGGSDVELNEAGLKQATKLVSFLKNENIDAVVSSPLKRALVTAQIIASQHQLPVEIHDGLKEINVGELEGLALSSLSITFSQLLMQWWQGGSERLPGGESFVELQERCWGAVEPLLAKYETGTVVIISHYFVTLAIIFKALDLPLEYLAKFRVDLGGVSILEFEDYGARLLKFNDTSYLSLLTG